MKVLPILVATTSLVVASINFTVYAQEFVEFLPSAGESANWTESKAKLQAFGEEFDTSETLFAFLKVKANGGVQLTWEDMKKPEYDWSGIFTRTKGGLSFDPELPANEISATLTDEGAAARQAKIDLMNTIHGEYDPISDCRAPGFPRWITEPFLHEFIVTPDTTWLVNEMVNDTRRVYTDGRDHTAEEDAYPTWNGDTIGFWDDDTLVTHTKYLMEGQYQRGTQPNYSDQVQVVERWRKVDGVTLQSDVWVFDPVNLAEPWYTRQSWTELANDDHLLRIRYWDCRENPNNVVIETEDGNSDFLAFDFMKSE
ncbi:hypothetical protein [Devosia sp. MC521]|uniref:hypothetical protein n=1 Tax=Devosia sp. MC521 TaxID=2759954 RepID=UPI0015FE27D2|nr:hypothetical protein [Devosia sp. MC521]MBJ6987831.1 hypothetical protein [Devosia sp. MC521]QMW63737.1 hypothetical protein H4N61_05275 [Devosia sp. MC521]